MHFITCEDLFRCFELLFCVATQDFRVFLQLVVMYTEGAHRLASAWGGGIIEAIKDQNSTPYDFLPRENYQVWREQLLMQYCCFIA